MSTPTVPAVGSHLREYAKRLVADWPPLTPTQQAVVRGVFSDATSNGTGRHADSEAA